MVVDYDLVVIGATYGGLVTAQRAIAAGQRVALVQQNEHPLRDMQERALLKVLSHYTAQSPSGKLEDLLSQAIAPWDFYEPLAQLSESGVDVIPETGRFQWQPETMFVTETRQLRSKYYAIATGSIWAKPPNENYLTPPDLLNQKVWESLENDILIVGQNPQLLALAHAFKKLGKRVQLILSSRLLPAEDQGLVHQIQTFLEVAGIEIYRDLTKVEKQQILEQENISVIWGDRPRGNTTQLNLPQDCCSPNHMWLKVNEQSQTSHQQIFGIGSVLGGYDLPELAIAEASTIAVNISQRKKQICPYAIIPYRLFEPYPFDHVGYQTKQPSKEIVTRQKTFAMDRVDQLQFPLNLTVKVWLDPQQKMLGATVLGDHSGKLIYHCRNLIQNKQTFTTWDNLLEQSGLLAEMCW